MHDHPTSAFSESAPVAQWLKSKYPTCKAAASVGEKRMEQAQMRIGSNAAIAIGTLCLFAIMIFAIADQEFSWWLFPFVILFSTIFLGILGICLQTYREDKLRITLKDKHPNEPWLWQAKWHSDIMTSRSKSEFWGTLAFTIILGMFALIGIASLFEGFSQGNLWVLLNLIPIGAAAYFVRNTSVAWRSLRLERFVSLSNETRPAWIGDRFSAQMTIEDGLDPDHVEAWLEHFKIIRREERDGTTFSKVVDCRLSGCVEDNGAGKARILVDIPQNSPATSWNEDEQSRWWDLVISMRVADVEVAIRYEVPVAEPTKHQNAGCIAKTCLLGSSR